MSKVVVEIDTVEKTMSVKVDGAELDDVQSMSAYVYSENDLSVNIGLMEGPEEKGGLRKYTTLCASEKAKASQEVLGKVGDFVKVEAGKPVHNSIANFLEQYR